MKLLTNQFFYVQYNNIGQTLPSFYYYNLITNIKRLILYEQYIIPIGQKRRH